MTGFGGVVSFEIAGDLETTIKFVDSLKIPYIAPSFGGCESIVDQPAIMDLPQEERLRYGIKDNLVRFSFGIEDYDDVEADVLQTLGLISHPEHHIAKRQMTGFGGVVSFEIAGDLETTIKFVDSLNIPYIAPSFGGCESIVDQPAIMSYWDLPQEERLRYGIKDNLVRFSFGIEDYDDVEADEKRVVRHEYGRYGNPTTLVLEKKISLNFLEYGASALEGAESTLVMASGMCANCYRKTRIFMETFLPKLGITVTVIDPVDTTGLEAAVNNHEVSMFFTESPTNPFLRCVDIELVSEICHKEELFTTAAINTVNLAISLSLTRTLSLSRLVSRVYYPGLTSHPEHHIAKRQMTGFGGVVSFEIAGDLETTIKFVDSLKIPYIAPSFGGCESIVDQPAIMDLPQEERLRYGIKDNLVRFSFGIEDYDDVEADVLQTLGIRWAQANTWYFGILSTWLSLS
ncbi:hypothetical protein Bca52824_093061 [Brassica carinata]|uniref:Uncharacterized protein n=1 Tax=Brassica carinata TaxID=52824 RepID=A0A8X7P6E1_BRACI|nr:hypothetical protein Bca52824_093061 [Brassica carinata]